MTGISRRVTFRVSMELWSLFEEACKQSAQPHQEPSHHIRSSLRMFINYYKARKEQQEQTEKYVRTYRKKHGLPVKKKKRAR